MIRKKEQFDRKITRWINSLDWEVAFSHSLSFAIGFCIGAISIMAMENHFNFINEIIN